MRWITDFVVYVKSISENRKNAVTSLWFLAFSSEQTEKPVGWDFWDNHNLNEGFEGKYIYMVWNKGEEELEPIVEIDFNVYDSKIPEKRGVSWTRINQDLGVKKYVWCSYFRG